MTHITTTERTAWNAKQATLSDTDILNKLKNVDGAGSGLDADLLDGYHASSFATAAQGTKADNAMPNTYGAINAVSTTSSLTLAQANKVIYTSNTTAIVLTIPASTSVAFVAGTQITFIQRLVGTVTFAPASGVTLESKDTKRTIDGLYASATLIYLGSNTWSLIGALA